MQMSVKDQNIIEDLALHGLLEALTRAQAEINFVENFQFHKDSIELKLDETEAINFLKKELRINNDEDLKKWKISRKLSNNNFSFLRFAKFRYKRSIIIKQLLKGNGESLYLRYKDRLDRVLYSLIRVKSQELAHHLYFSIDSSEISFGEAAEKYSEGTESKTRGIIGPVDLTTPHPEVSARLRTANPGHLFAPFIADDWFVIIRLEYRFESEYDEKTRDFLGGLLMGGKSKGISDDLLKLHLELEDN